MKRLTCAHSNPLAEPCTDCDADMSTADRLQVTGQRVNDLALRGIPTRYARSEFDALMLRASAEGRQP